MSKSQQTGAKPGSSLKGPIKGDQQIQGGPMTGQKRQGGGQKAGHQPQQTQGSGDPASKQADASKS